MPPKKKFIKGAIKKPGALRKTLGAKKGRPIPLSKLQAAAKKPGKTGQRARLALTLRKMNSRKRTTTRRRTTTARRRRTTTRKGK
jgi:hypothetical protein